MRTSESKIVVRAAVAILLAENRRKVLLIQRAELAGDPWSGHIALPGGRFEPDDVSLQAAACRETLEEVGLDLRGEKYLGTLPTVAPLLLFGGRRFEVHPFVFELSSIPALVPNMEVQRTFWVDIAGLRDPEAAVEHLLQHQGRSLRYPGWDIEGRTVWGMTYRVLLDLLRSSFL